MPPGALGGRREPKRWDDTSSKMPIATMSQPNASTPFPGAYTNA